MTPPSSHAPIAMTTFNRLKYLSAAASALVTGILAMPAMAHDVWVEARDGGFTVLYGHGTELEAYDPLKVKTLTALDAQGRSLPVSRRPATGPASVMVAIDGKPALSTLYFDDGFWTKTEAGWKNLPKNAVQGAVLQSASYVQAGKTVYAWLPLVTQPQGLPLEIVPLRAQAPTAGSQVQVQVLWEGRPLAGAKIALPGPDKPAPAVTDAQGRASIPVVGGRQIISVTHKLPLKDERADELSFTANLVFTAAR